MKAYEDRVLSETTQKHCICRFLANSDNTAVQILPLVLLLLLIPLQQIRALPLPQRPITLILDYEKETVRCLQKNFDQKEVHDCSDQLKNFNGHFFVRLHEAKLSRKNKTHAEKEAKCQSIQISRTSQFVTYPQLCFSGKIHIEEVNPELLEQLSALGQQLSTGQKLREEFYLLPLSELNYFFDNCLDDVIEDLAAILIPGLITYGGYSLGLSNWLLLPLFATSYIFLGNAGRQVSDLVENENEHSESDHYLGIFASNLMEDSLKAGYLFIEFIDLFALQLVRILYLNRSSSPSSGQSVSSKGFTYTLVGLTTGICLLKDMRNAITSYTWINEWADLLGDEAKATVNYYLLPQAPPANAD